MSQIFPPGKTVQTEVGQFGKSKRSGGRKSGRSGGGPPGGVMYRRPSLDKSVGKKEKN